jgi:hypothetical protein
MSSNVLTEYIYPDVSFNISSDIGKLISINKTKLDNIYITFGTDLQYLSSYASGNTIIPITPGNDLTSLLGTIQLDISESAILIAQDVSYIGNSFRLDIKKTVVYRPNSDILYNASSFGINQIISCASGASNYSVTLPDPSTCPGQTLFLFNAGSSYVSINNTYLFVGKIDKNFFILSTYDTASLISNNTSWVVFATSSSTLPTIIITKFSNNSITFLVKNITNFYYTLSDTSSPRIKQNTTPIILNTSESKIFSSYTINSLLLNRNYNLEVSYFENKSLKSTSLIADLNKIQRNELPTVTGTIKENGDLTFNSISYEVSGNYYGYSYNYNANNFSSGLIDRNNTELKTISLIFLSPNTYYSLTTIFYSYNNAYKINNYNYFTTPTNCKVFISSYSAEQVIFNINGSFDSYKYNFGISQTNFFNNPSLTQPQLTLTFPLANTNYILSSIFYNSANVAQAQLNTSIVSLSNGSATVLLSDTPDNYHTTWNLNGSFFKFKHNIGTIPSNNVFLDTFTTYNNSLQLLTSPNTTYYLNIIFYNSADVPQPQFSTNYTTPKGTQGTLATLTKGSVDTDLKASASVDGSYNNFTYRFYKSGQTIPPFLGNRSILIDGKIFSLDVTYNSTYYLDVSFNYGDNTNDSSANTVFILGKGRLSNTLSYDTTSSANILKYNINGSRNYTYEYNFGLTDSSQNLIQANGYTFTSGSDLLYNKTYYLNILLSNGNDYETLPLSAHNTTYSNGSVTYDTVNSTYASLVWKLDGSFAKYKYGFGTSQTTPTIEGSSSPLALDSSANTLYHLSIIFYNSDQQAQPRIDTTVTSLPNGDAAYSTSDNNLITWEIRNLSAFRYYRYYFNTTSRIIENNDNYTIMYNSSNTLRVSAPPDVKYYLSIVFYNSADTPQVQITRDYTTAKGTTTNPGIVDNMTLVGQTLSWRIGGGYTDFKYYFGVKTDNPLFGGNKYDLSSNRLVIVANYNRTYYLNVSFTYDTGYTSTSTDVSYSVPKGPPGTDTVNVNNNTSNKLIWTISGGNYVDYKIFFSETYSDPTVRSFAGSTSIANGTTYTYTADNLRNLTPYYFSVLFNYGTDYNTLQVNRDVTTITGLKGNANAILRTNLNGTLIYDISGNYTSFKYYFGTVSDSSANKFPDSYFTKNNTVFTISGLEHAQYFFNVTFTYSVALNLLTNTSFNDQIIPELSPTLPSIGQLTFSATSVNTMKVSFNVSGGIYTKIVVGSTIDSISSSIDIATQDNTVDLSFAILSANITFSSGSTFSAIGQKLTLTFKPYYNSKVGVSNTIVNELVLETIKRASNPLYTEIFIKGSSGSGGTHGETVVILYGNTTSRRGIPGIGGNGGGSYLYLGTRNFLNAFEPATGTFSIGSGGVSALGRKLPNYPPNDNYQIDNRVVVSGLNGNNGKNGTQSVYTYGNMVITISGGGPGLAGGGAVWDGGSTPVINGANGSNGLIGIESDNSTVSRYGTQTNIGTSGTSGYDPILNADGTTKDGLYGSYKSSLAGEDGKIYYLYYYVNSNKVISEDTLLL